MSTDIRGHEALHHHHHRNATSLSSDKVIAQGMCPDAYTLAHAFKKYVLVLHYTLQEIWVALPG